MSKWSSSALLPRPVTKMICSIPASSASSTAYWMSGRSTIVSISFGIALVAGRKRVPRPATGKTALLTFFIRLSGTRAAASAGGRKVEADRPRAPRSGAGCRPGAPAGRSAGGVSSSSVVGGAGAAWAGLGIAAPWAAAQRLAASAGGRASSASADRQARRRIMLIASPITEAAAARSPKIRRLAGRARQHLPPGSCAPHPASCLLLLPACGKAADASRASRARPAGLAGTARRAGGADRPARPLACRQARRRRPRSRIREGDLGLAVGFPGQAACWSICGRPGARPAWPRCRPSTLWPSARTASSRCWRSARIWTAATRSTPSSRSAISRALEPYLDQ